MGTEQECIAWIRERLRIVDSLLSDPETGIGTWHLMYGKEMQAITDYWLHGWEFAMNRYEAKNTLREKLDLAKTEVQTLSIRQPFQE